MAFRGIQKTFSYKQINEGNIEAVFPLLCPVREKDWLDGWKYKMIHSKSGLIEKDCVFTTPYKKEKKTVWQVTQYCKENKIIEFLRVTPNENVVRINIKLTEKSENQTFVDIEYKHTALNEKQNNFIENKLNKGFNNAMIWWEKAINHYLKTGKMLKKIK